MKRQASLVDTNIILRYLLADHKTFYQQSSMLFEKVRFGTARIVISESVLMECIYVLMEFYHVPKAEVVDKLSQIMRYRGIANDDKKVLLAAMELFAAENVDPVDALLLAKARINQWDLISFDERMSKRIADDHG